MFVIILFKSSRRKNKTKEITKLIFLLRFYCDFSQIHKPLILSSI